MNRIKCLLLLGLVLLAGVVLADEPLRFYPVMGTNIVANGTTNTVKSTAADLNERRWADFVTVTASIENSGTNALGASGIIFYFEAGHKSSNFGSGALKYDSWQDSAIKLTMTPQGSNYYKISRVFQVNGAESLRLGAIANTSGGALSNAVVSILWRPEGESDQ